MSTYVSRCSRCGQKAYEVHRLWLCQDCRDDLSGRPPANVESMQRLARTVTSCCRALADMMILCVRIILSKGQDRESMARMMNDREAINDIDKELRNMSKRDRWLNAD